LAGQEAFNFAGASVLFLLNQPEYERTANWPTNKMIALRKLMADEQQSMSEFVSQLRSAADALQFLIGDTRSVLDSEKLAQLLTVIDGIAHLAPSRKLMQWRIANLAWRIRNLAHAKSDASAIAALSAGARRWSELISDSHFDRWLKEALAREAPPLKTVGFRILTPEQFTKRAPTLGV
jgi:hypothetical protein